MKNKIPCSAEKLSLLEPTMIQSVVEASAFQLGTQYLGENRVRIVEADAVQITSAVIGKSGLHEQQIRLKDGVLVSKCSCPLTEQPMCRHCVAVLLEYHRWAKPTPQKTMKDRPVQEPPASDLPKTPPSSDINLRDLTTFIEWIQLAVTSLDGGIPLPDGPNVGSPEVQTWVESLQRVEARRREVEAQHYSLKAELDTREVQINRLTQQLQVSVQDIKAAHQTANSLQRELTQCRGILGKVSELAKDMERFDSQIKTVAGDLAKHGSQLDHLSSSVKQASSALHTLSKPPSS